VKPKIIIEVSGGVVTEVRSSIHDDIEVVVLDRDDEKAATSEEAKAHFEKLAEEFDSLPYHEPLV
jgi:hypothetical protein